MDPDGLAVRTRGLTKRFGDTQALAGIDLAVPRATVLGLLGPNGAGKTTAVRILTTLLRPDSGEASIDGIDVVTGARRVRARIGLTGQYAAVDERLTATENLEHVGRLLRLGRAEARRRTAALLAQFDLTDAAERAVRGFSGGMRRRLDIAMSLIGRPSVLFLDEPTTGLDPRSRQAMWDLIDALVRDGTTTVLTTQYLDEAERLADRIAVVDRGLVIAEGTAAELKSQVGGATLTVTLADPGQAPAAADALARLAGVTGVPSPTDPPGTSPGTSPGTAVVSVPVASAEGTVPAAVRCLDAAGVGVVDAEVTLPTLDDVFLRITGRPAEAPADDGAGTPAGPVGDPGGSR